MAPTPTMDSKSWLMLMILSIIWAGSFLLTEIALRELPPLAIMTARVTIGAIGLYGMMLVAGVGFPSRDQVAPLKLVGAFMVLGILNNVIPFSVLVWGQTHMSASLASILNATMPLFTVILAHYFTVDEKITSNKLVGVLIGIGGVAVIVGEHGIDFSSGSNFAKIAILGAPFSYAVAALIARRFAAWNLSPLFVAFGQSAAAAVVALPLTTLVENPWGISVSVTGWASLIALGLFCSSVAYLIYFRLIATAGATNTSLITLTIPPFAVVSGVLLLGESLSMAQVAGMALILFGLLVTDGRLKLRSRGRVEA